MFVIDSFVQSPDYLQITYLLRVWGKEAMMSEEKHGMVSETWNNQETEVNG